jgi:hypothetical protein
MWLRKGSQDDKRLTDYEYDKKKRERFTDSEAASMNDHHSEPGDDWNEKIPISDKSNHEPL